MLMDEGAVDLAVAKIYSELSDLVNSIDKRNLVIAEDIAIDLMLELAGLVAEIKKAQK